MQKMLWTVLKDILDIILKANGLQNVKKYVLSQEKMQTCPQIPAPTLIVHAL